MRLSTMNKVQESIIELDKKKINESIEEKGLYKEGDEVLIKRWDSEGDSDNYICEIKKDNSKFIGVLNGRLERNGYGIHCYKTGEKYLGYFEQDQPNKHGIYMWSPMLKGKTIHTECYHGRWTNNKKDKSGIYLWMNEPFGNELFEKANFDVYVGEFDNDKYVRGTYLSKVSDDYYLYHGNFDSDGKKSDDNAFFYSSKRDRILHGKIVKDAFVSAYITFFDSKSGNIEKVVYAFFDKFGGVNKIILQESLKTEECENEKKMVTQFRGVILSENYFGNIYNKYKEVDKFIKDKKMESIEILEDEEVFPKIMKLVMSHRSNNIYFDIETKALQRNNNSY